MSVDNNGAAWFTPRRYGLGVGAPIAWQGWALLGGYLAVVAALVLSGGRPNGGALAMFLGLTAGFIELARGRTRGGWKWRWGKHD